VWIDTDRGADAIKHLRSVAREKMEEEAVRDRRMAEARRAWYRRMHREVEDELKEEKRAAEGEAERARKREKARLAKAAYENGGEMTLKKGKWKRLTQG